VRQTVQVIPARLSVITLGALDMPRLHAFYRAMGWRSRAGPNDRFASFLLGGALLALYPRDQLRAEAPPGPGTSTGIALALNVNNREQADELRSGH
jgi:uncharacterized protein